ncbi:MAG TPA: deoxyguanosinetriphosphate triphosphohydrolase [Candidatus Acidoferrales bacterium]|nr:deoxyguanosinetriphosphate triphosphohydrolase [Candidatus Acidoferrales bacterium]
MVLAGYAMDARHSRGRRYPEAVHAYRNEFARDRDRIIHSRSFRRLQEKTQVFTVRFSDHFRSRLTHTLEVSQISRTVAAALGLNQDLAEALALVHDIGHPPFGHAGEAKLDQLMRAHGERFDHNLHALRIVEQFEQQYLDFPGLNLTFELREGILKHSRAWTPEEFPEAAEFEPALRPPLEAQLIDLADEIAYNTSDIDDGWESELLPLELILEETPRMGIIYREIDRQHPSARVKLKLLETIKRVLDHLATDLISSTRKQIESHRPQSPDDVRRFPLRLASFSPDGASWSSALKTFLHQRLYNHPELVEERDRSVAALEQLFQFFCQNPREMPPFHAALAAGRPPHRVVCDYIAGMTDRFLMQEHRRLVGAPAS